MEEDASPSQPQLPIEKLSNARHTTPRYRISQAELKENLRVQFEMNRRSKRVADTKVSVNATPNTRAKSSFGRKYPKRLRQNANHIDEGVATELVQSNEITQNFNAPLSEAETSTVINVDILSTTAQNETEKWKSDFHALQAENEKLFIQIQSLLPQVQLYHEACQSNNIEARKEITKMIAEEANKQVTEQVERCTKDFSDALQLKENQCENLEQEVERLASENLQLQNLLKQSDGRVDEKEKEIAELRRKSTDISTSAPISNDDNNKNTNLYPASLLAKEIRRKYLMMKVTQLFWATYREHMSAKRHQMEQTLALKDAIIDRQKELLEQQANVVEQARLLKREKDSYAVQCNSLSDIKKQLEAEVIRLNEHNGAAKVCYETWSRTATAYARSLNDLAVFIQNQDYTKMPRMINGKCDFFYFLDKFCAMMGVPNHKSLIDTVRSQCTKIEVENANLFLEKFQPLIGPLDYAVIRSLLAITNCFCPFI